MQGIQERVFQASNRVEMVVGFVTGASITKDTAVHILDAFRVTQDLLLQMGPTGQRDELSRLLGSEHPLARPADDDWQSIVASQIKLWQAAQLSQKTIETVGDLFATWVPQREDPKEFAGALRHLEFMVTLEPESHAELWTTSGTEFLHSKIRSLAMVLAGLAVVVANKKTVDHREAFTGASFGASLVVKGMSSIVGIE